MINTSIGLVGVAKQADKSTAATTPTFKHGLTGGGLIKPERSVEQKNIACGLRANTANGAYVSEVNIAVDYETVAYADVLGLYLYAALGAVATTAAGKSGYYTHTIKLGNSIPYLTFWGQVGDTAQSTVFKATGCKMDTLSFSFEGNAPLDIGVTAAGVDADLFGAWSDSAEPSCFDGYFIPTGGKFLMATGSQTPAACSVSKGSLDLSNNLSTHFSAGSVTPDELCEGKLTTSGSVTVMPDDWALIRTLLTGSAMGTEVTSQIVYGSLEWTFTHSQDENCQLVLAVKNIPFTCDTPEVDPEGNYAEIDFSFDNVGIASKTDSPVVATLTNKVTSYAA